MSGKNWENKTVFTGDNLPVMRGMNSDTVDLIYLDPPFNSKRLYKAPIGSKAAAAAFKDTWTLTDIDLVEHNRMKSGGAAPVLSDSGRQGCALRCDVQLPDDDGAKTAGNEKNSEADRKHISSL